MKKQWRKRVHGTINQKGNAFMLPTQSQQGLKARLPKVKGKTTLRYPTGKVVNYSIENMPIEQLSTKETIIQDPNPENFEERVNHFIKMYNRGETIPPILYHRMENGQIQVLDGRARLEAFRRLNLSRIPAVENGFLSSIKSGLSNIAGIVTGKISPPPSAKNDMRAIPPKPTIFNDKRQQDALKKSVSELRSSGS
jgi:hypothetical protein